MWRLKKSLIMRRSKQYIKMEIVAGRDVQMQSRSSKIPTKGSSTQRDTLGSNIELNRMARYTPFTMRQRLANPNQYPRFRITHRNFQCEKQIQQVLKPSLSPEPQQKPGVGSRNSRFSKSLEYRKTRLPQVASSRVSSSKANIMHTETSQDSQINSPPQQQTETPSPIITLIGEDQLQEFRLKSEILQLDLLRGVKPKWNIYKRPIEPHINSRNLEQQISALDFQIKLRLNNIKRHCNQKMSTASTFSHSNLPRKRGRPRKQRPESELTDSFKLRLSDEEYIRLINDMDIQVPLDANNEDCIDDLWDLIDPEEEVSDEVFDKIEKVIYLGQEIQRVRKQIQELDQDISFLSRRSKNKAQQGSNRMIYSKEAKLRVQKYLELGLWPVQQAVNYIKQILIYVIKIQYGRRSFQNLPPIYSKSQKIIY